MDASLGHREHGHDQTHASGVVTIAAASKFYVEVAIIIRKKARDLGPLDNVRERAHRLGLDAVGHCAKQKERAMGVDEQETVEVGASSAKTFPWDVADKMAAYLIERADALAAHADNPRAEAELERVVALIEAYEAKRWPSGKVAGGKG
jgi:hypothetical protein